MENKKLLNELGFRYDTYGNFKLLIDECMIDVHFDNYDLNGIPEICINELTLPTIKEWKPFIIKLIENAESYYL
tara:strand:+ start:1035 stop:1256 length:222 start_codon:yes stop_codon:yes gene_type:complete